MKKSKSEVVTVPIAALEAVLAELRQLVIDVKKQKKVTPKIRSDKKVVTPKIRSDKKVSRKPLVFKTVIP
jgi:hypothetical protein